MGVIPFLTMRAKRTYLSGMRKREHLDASMVDHRFGTVTIAIDVHIFLKGLILHFGHFVQKLFDGDIAKQHQ